MTGLPKVITVTSTEMLEAFEEPVERILEAVHGVLERTPPELVADISNNGIVMTGGGSLVDGFDRLIEARTGIATLWWRRMPFPAWRRVPARAWTP